MLIPVILNIRRRLPCRRHDRDLIVVKIVYNFISTLLGNQDNVSLFYERRMLMSNSKCVNYLHFWT